MHSFGNASDQIRDAYEEMLELAAFYENYDRIPDYVKIDTNDTLVDLVGLRPTDVLNEGISKLVCNSAYPTKEQSRISGTR